jgi:hypothetical protein
MTLPSRRVRAWRAVAGARRVGLSICRVSARVRRHATAPYAVVVFDRSDHPDFIDQPPSNGVVWRYMDLARYLSLLQSSALHFARVDQMEDRWEGAYGSANIKARPTIYGEHFEQMRDAFPQLRQASRTLVNINCWHMSEVESAAMWSIYQRDGRGVAVVSTWEKLTSSITDEQSIYGTAVRYVDYETTLIPESSLFQPLLHKRQSFSHEQEVRLLAMRSGEGPAPVVLPVAVDLKELITEVRVAPDAPSWFADVVREATTRYGQDFEVNQSSLGVDPID